MRNIMLAAALVLTSILAPGASALSVGPGCVHFGETDLCTPPVDATETPDPRDLLPSGGVDVGALIMALNAHIDTLQEELQEAGNEIGTQPGVYAVGSAHDLVCAGTDNPQCRVTSGRAVVGGTFEACGERRAQNALAHDTAYTVDATAFAFAGSRAVCEDRWPTLFGLATLP